MKHNFRCWVLALIVATALAAPKLHAQDGMDDDGGVPASTASLSLHIDHAGTAEFNLLTPSEISNRDAWNAFLASAWKCSVHGDISRAPRFGRITPQQNEEMENFWNEAAKHKLNATCRGLTRHAFQVQGTLGLQPIMDLLKADGVQAVMLNLYLPPAPTTKVEGPAPRHALPEYGLTEYELRVDQPVSPLRLNFGYTHRDLIRLSLYSVSFIVVPLLLIVVMRTSALRRGEIDRAAAWFSFMKTTMFCVNGMFLLWAATDLNTRQSLLDVAKFIGWDQGWRSVAAEVGVVLIPAWIIYILSTALSYKVFVLIRKGSIGPGQFMVRQLGHAGKTFVPLSFYLAGILTMAKNLRAGLAMLALGWLANILCVLLLQKLERSHPSALTSGPLRDRIFALAHNMGVKIQQVFVVPAAQSGAANAFATAKQTVFFTDYLIEKLSQREVDAVAAHELTHLRHKHAQTLGFMIWGVVLLPNWIIGFAGGVVQGALIFVPGAGRWRALVHSVVTSGWPQALVMMGLFWLYYFIQKRFEYTADAGAVNATRDPEAMITALAKISKLNLTPLQWSRRTEAMLTHPSTMRRVQRIARNCGMPDGHLQMLLAPSESTPNPISTAQGYSLTKDQTGMVSVARGGASALQKLLFLMTMHLLPASAIAFCLQKVWPQLGSQWWALAAGAAISVLLYFMGLAWMSRSSNRRTVKAILKAAASNAGPLPVEQGIPVGFAPGPSPRFFVSSYNWDYGLLYMSPEKLVFKGKHATLGLQREQIRSVLLGQGAPSWMNWRRVYFSWEDRESGRSGTFNLLALRPHGLFQVDSHQLYLQVRAWRNSPQPATPELKEPGVPSFGAVTSMSVKEVSEFSRTIGITGVMLMLALGLSTVLKLDTWYIAGTVLLLRVFERIPHIRYRERPMVFDAATALMRFGPAAQTMAAPPPPPPPKKAQPEVVPVS